jgi:hypothetical protein
LPSAFRPWSFTGSKPQPARAVIMNIISTVPQISV